MINVLLQRVADILIDRVPKYIPNRNTTSAKLLYTLLGQHVGYYYMYQSRTMYMSSELSAAIVAPQDCLQRILCLRSANSLHHEDREIVMLFFCWMAWTLSMLAIADIQSRTSETLTSYPRTLNDGVLKARAPIRLSRSPGPMQRRQSSTPQAQGSSAVAREPNDSSTQNGATARARSPSSSSRSSSRSSSPSMEEVSTLSPPIVQGFAQPPFTARCTKEEHQAPLEHSLTGPPSRKFVVGQRQASIRVQTMKNEETGAAGRAALMASGHELARVNINTLNGGTGYIESDPHTRPGRGRIVLPGETHSITLERQHPMREMSAGVEVNSPGQITAEAKNLKLATKR